MAIVKGPALSISASGNLGSICYSTWRSLQIARGVWTGTVPNTAKQVVQQGYMTAVAQAWGVTLTVDDRQSWIRRARTVTWRSRLGDTYIPNGYQLYMKWNIRRLVMGLALMNTAPAAQEWVVVTFLQLVNAAPTHVGVNLKASVLPGPIQGYGSEFWKAGPYDSGGRTPIEGEWRFLNRQAPPTFYQDTDVILGKWYWYRGRAISKFGDVQNWFEEQIEFV